MSLEPLHRCEQRLGALPMPSPLVWAALAAAFLAFGVLIGRATGSSAVASLAANRAPVKVLMAQAPATAAPVPTTPATPPAAPEAETTPAPAPAPASPANETKQGAASGTSPAGSSGSSKGSAGGGEGSAGGGEGSSSPGVGAKLPAIKHVFVVMLDDEPYATAFGPASPAHYLTGPLEKQGELLVRYYGVAHEGLANGIALLSGQGPTEATAANCPKYSEIAPASAGANGQVLGQGCVYATSTPTLMAQLTAKHFTWKAYIEGIDERAGTPPACAHPATGAPDPSVSFAAGAAAPGYQTWRNPFVYFSSVAGSSACAEHDVGMKRLTHDLASQASTPTFSYIAPGPCDDGNPTPCASGKASGMVASDSFLHKLIPRILASKVYKQGGLLAITVDNAPSSGEYADSSSCCGQPYFPNLPAPTGSAKLSPPGGGQVGLLLLSPFIKKGGLAQETYDHFSLLATIEQVFGLGKLGYAGLAEAKPFSASLFSGG
ncbi:MAG TPA: alkaline phosphatase family protein [Solirubrobacteraceae bacterium]|nr:alkaline phosphatase family protein [Solirubrobacteraceae bacterium]